MERAFEWWHHNRQLYRDVFFRRLVVYLRLDIRSSGMHEIVFDKWNYLFGHVGGYYERW